MARVQLKAGAEVDFLTNDELGGRLDKLENRLRSYIHEREGTIRVHTGAEVPTDSGGDALTGPYDGGYQVFQVPEGFVCYLVRQTWDYTGSLTVADGNASANALTLYADAATPSAVRTNLAAAKIPAIEVESRSHAPMFRGGQRIVACIANLTASDAAVQTTVLVGVQVILVPHKAMTEHDPRLMDRDLIIGIFALTVYGIVKGAAAAGRLLGRLTEHTDGQR